MKAKDKNREAELSEFLRYTGGKMTDSERNAFERKLQKDPFAAEAAEGLSGISPDEASKDLITVEKKIEAIVYGRRRFIYYRVAASIAVLMILSSVYLIIRQTKPESEISEISSDTVTFEISRPQAINEIPVPESKEKTVSREKKESRAGTEQKQDITPVKSLPAEERKPSEELKFQEVQMAKTAKKDDARDIVVVAADKKMAGAPSAFTTKIEAAGLQVSGRLISSEDNQPIPGATIQVKGSTKGVLTDTGGNFKITLSGDESRTLVANYIGMETKEFQATDKNEMEVTLDPSVAALSEIVVTGYGAEKKDEEEQSFYTPPQPADGQRNFDRYIEDNIRKPESMEAGQRAVVVVNFVVKSSGIIDSIRVIRSPGEAYSGEAIRLIRNGPSWNPAVSNGERIDGEVRIRIVFK
jgi:TonB family protein